MKIQEERNRININCGCPQGNKTSPFFFNAVINSLIIKLMIVHGIKIMVFADDIAILADSLRALIQSIEIIEHWCKENKMQLNKKKSHIIFIKSKPKSIK